MAFTLKKLNAIWTDLPQAKVELYQKAQEMAYAYGKTNILRQAVLVQIVSEYGEYGLQCIERWCARAMTSLDRLQSLLDKQEPLEFTAPVKVNELPGRERKYEGDIKTPQSFLTGITDAKKMEKAFAPPAKKKLPPGYYDRDGAIGWMQDNHPADLDLIDQYFDYQGYNQVYGAMYFLRVRVSQ